MFGRDHRAMQIEQYPVEDLAAGSVKNQSHDPLVSLGVDQPARARLGDHGDGDLAALAIGHFQEAAHSCPRPSPGGGCGITNERRIAVAEESPQWRWRGRKGIRFMLEASQQ
ncbi:hypothetical protein D3C87_1556720 [compost metagenome]